MEKNVVLEILERTVTLHGGGHQPNFIDLARRVRTVLVREATKSNSEEAVEIHRSGRSLEFGMITPVLPYQVGKPCLYGSRVVHRSIVRVEHVCGSPKAES